MRESWTDFARVNSLALLPSCAVGTNESLRQRALRLVNLGFSHKVLAGKMEIAPSTFSKWLRQKEGIGPVSVTALDGFNAYIQVLGDEIAEIQRSDGRSLAGSLEPSDQSDPVPGAANAAVRRAVAGLDGLAREAEQAGGVGRPPRAAPIAREHAAKPRAQTTRRRPRARTRRRKHAR